MGWGRCGTIFGAVALSLASCGGSSESGAPPDTGAANDEASDTEAVERRADLTDAIVIPVLETVPEGPVADAATTIFADHGGVEGWTLLLVALDVGYTIEQILVAPHLTADGVIDGVAPAGLPVEFLDDAPAEPEGFRAIPREGIYDPSNIVIDVLDIKVAEAHTQATLHALDQMEESYRGQVEAAIGVDLTGMTPQEIQYEIDRARERQREEKAAELAAARERQEQLDEVTRLTLFLTARGYSLEQTVETIVFGEYRIVSGPPCVLLPFEPAGTPVLADFVPGCSGQVDPDVVVSAEPVGPDTTTSTSTPTTTAPDSDQEVRLEWTIEIPPDPAVSTIGDATTNWGPTSVTINRTPGTNEFTVSLSESSVTESTYTSDGFDEFRCTSRSDMSFAGTGTFVPDQPELIEIIGEQTRSSVFEDCPSGTDTENTEGGILLTLRVTPDGLASNFQDIGFVIPGEVPVPA